MTEQSEWVSLGEAADILGVHPTTVRHWADSGDLPSQRTPGGHRRFRRADLESWSQGGTSSSDTGDIQLMIQSTLGRTRMQLVGDEKLGFEWRGQISDADRQAHAALGRRLLQLLNTHLSDPTDEASLQEVHDIGVEYGQLSRANNLALADAVDAYLFFRDVLTDSVIQMSETLSIRTSGDWGERLRQINLITGQLLLALIEGYEGDDGQAD